MMILKRVNHNFIHSRPQNRDIYKASERWPLSINFQHRQRPGKLFTIMLLRTTVLVVAGAFLFNAPHANGAVSNLRPMAAKEKDSSLEDEAMIRHLVDEVLPQIPQKYQGLTPYRNALEIIRYVRNMPRSLEEMRTKLPSIRNLAALTGIGRGTIGHAMPVVKAILRNPRAANEEITSLLKTCKTTDAPPDYGQIINDARRMAAAKKSRVKQVFATREIDKYARALPLLEKEVEDFVATFGGAMETAHQNYYRLSGYLNRINDAFGDMSADDDFPAVEIANYLERLEQLERKLAPIRRQLAKPGTFPNGTSYRDINTCI